MTQRQSLTDAIAGSDSALAHHLRNMPYSEIDGICRRSGISKGVLRWWVEGREPAGWLKRRISAALDVPVEQLWPSRSRRV